MGAESAAFRQFRPATSRYSWCVDHCDISVLEFAPEEVEIGSEGVSDPSLSYEFSLHTRTRKI
jgi:hypothetical protein